MSKRLRLALLLFVAAPTLFASGCAGTLQSIFVRANEITQFVGALDQLGIINVGQ